MQLKREIKFETLRKSHKKQIIIGSVLVCIVGSILTFNLTKAKYRLTQSMKLVTGTINYKVPDLRIVAVNISEDGTNYEIINDIPERGYTLNEEKSICKVATETSGIENAPKDSNITIEYIEGKLNIRGVSKRNTRCYLYFDKYIEPSETTLAKLNINSSYIKSGTPDFTKVATGAETVADNGIYKMADPMYGGESYYWRGAATSNHVIFANKCWRIIRINGDGSIRLIYNGTVQSGNVCLVNGAFSISSYNQKYNASFDNSAYVGYTFTSGVQRPTPTTGGTASNLKTQTETWFDANVTGNNLNKIDLQGKYCNDRNTASGNTWVSTGNTFYYAGYDRSGAKSETSVKPILACDTQDIYELKAGAIIMDEVIMAGGKYNTSNNSYYLYNSQDYWTMSPYYLYGNGVPDANVFYVNTSGELKNYGVGNSRSVRPAINLRSDVTFNAGSNGTQNNPYIVQ